MKKVFIEPQIKKIELNLKENIADSSILVDGFRVRHEDMYNCVIVDTGFTIWGIGGSTQERIEFCRGRGMSGSRSREVIVPEEEVMKYLR